MSVAETNIDSPLASPEQGRQETEINPFERFRLGGDELAICEAIDLGPNEYRANPSTRLILIDVGFRVATDGSYGPYDIDGSGEKRTFKKPYVLVNQIKTANGLQTFTYDFDAEEPVIIGRSAALASTAEPLKLTLDPEISRQHVKLMVNKHGNISTEDLGSTNGTSVKSAIELLGTSGVRFGYTASVTDFVHGGKDRPSQVQKGWGFGEYEGRPIIARDTPINGGVYPVGGKKGEALVIDDQKYPKELNQVYEEVVSLLDTVSAQKISKQGIKGFLNKRKGVKGGEALIEHNLETVFQVVTKTLRYDLAATEAMADSYEKITLNSYIYEGVGVCRTQATLSAYVIERLITNGKLNGRVSIDRNHDSDVAGGHAWARFTGENGEVYIIDPAQEYVGTLKAATESNRWAYSRTEDYMKQLLKV